MSKKLRALLIPLLLLVRWLFYLVLAVLVVVLVVGLVFLAAINGYYSI